MAEQHRPVLLEKVLDGLQVRADGLYVDATFGRGGHAGAVLKKLGVDGRLVALDRDPEAIAVAQKQFGSDNRFTALKGGFGDIKQLLETEGVTGEVHGVLFDLGVSSPQLDDPQRGFSFTKHGPLDMRMDPDEGQPASRWINSASQDEIADVIRRYGEERFSRRIARRIVTDRQQAPIGNTLRLSEIVSAAVPRREPGRHPATRTFQAIRIFVNRELDELEGALDQVPDLLAGGGRLCVISFHSLEDRIVKRFMRRKSMTDSRYAGLPEIPDWAQPVLKIVGKQVRPDQSEVDANSRARSAVLRVAEKRN